MTSDAEDPLDIDLAASTLQSNSTDLRILLKALVSQLGDALGNRLEVQRAGGRFRKSDDIRSVQVQLGDDVLRADVDGSSVRCTAAHSSGGIRIRSEQIPMDEWLRRLLGSLKAEAAHSDQARVALENIVLGGT
jgi:hypothetical protein